MPSALPYIFTALKIAATASVVGAIIGEAPASIQEGLGGAIINFNQYYVLEPENLWATNLYAALLGILFFLAVVLAEKLVVASGHRSGSYERRAEAPCVSSERRKGVSKVFAKGGVTALAGHRPRGRQGRVRLADRAVRVREVDAPAHRRRHRRAVRRRGHRERQARAAGRLDRDYGIVFQAPVLYDWRTVAKNIALPLEMLGWSRAKRSERVEAMLELVELTGFAGHHPWELSGGMQQRVSIARALSFSPALLLMDEPFGALDEMTRERLNMELLRIWAETGSTVVFVTHSISEAVFLSTRVVVMSARPGRITSVVPIELPQPRAFETREDPRFFELVTEVRELLHADGRRRGRGGAARGRGRRVSTVAEPLAPRAALSERVRYWLPAVVVFALGIVAWQWILPDLLHVESYLVPRFSDVLAALRDNRADSGRGMDHVQGGVRRIRASGARPPSSRRSSSPAGARSETP